MTTMDLVRLVREKGEARARALEAQICVLRDQKAALEADLALHHSATREIVEGLEDQLWMARREPRALTLLVLHLREQIGLLMARDDEAPYAMELWATQEEVLCG